ncbi:SulP family inorganic anion transporter [Aliibacillus thermotolerans]|uniref:SulP family inorganic anion transporter n=1 Tax=Aliibacillus thermotolerans TaxID=1834418 RepID=A0ABW0U2J7_9BACI|nr:sulfate permease [Aliibacillus thermotolerans]MDA3128515.1 sulfate permease [Aliibacillus thermotolerans]
MIKKLIPATEWLATYHKKDLKGDMTAGIIVAIMLVPQGMAYAMLAGLPPVMGLYASVIPLIIYALFGTSRHLAVGPVAMVSLLVFAGVSTISEPGTEEYISLVLLLMLMIGIIQFAMGILRLGFLVNFLSQAVISGFTSAAAIIIGFSQLKHLLGFHIESDNVFLMLWEAGRRLSEMNLVAFVIGVGGIILLLTLKKIAPKIPGPLAVVVVSAFAVYFFGLEEKGVQIVGEVPSGFPSFSVPTVTKEALVALLPTALTISFIGFMESIAMGKVIAAKENYKIDPNRELVGLGLANVGGSFFSGFPVTGGFSRSAVNYQAGARTPLAAVMTAFFIFITLLFFTDWFYYLPQATLAAIIMTAVYGLIDLKEAKTLFSVRWLDGFTWLVTFIATLTLGIEQGILIGAAFSIVVFLGKSAYPAIVEVDVPKRSKVAVFRIDSSLYFANIGHVEEKICQLLDKKREAKWLVVDFSSVNSVDAIAVQSLEQLLKTCDHVEVFFVGMKDSVKKLCQKAGWETKYQNELKFQTVNNALQHITTKNNEKE